MIAQLNLARTIAPLDAPEMAEFTNNLDRINQLAEQAEGFVWRLKDDSGNATAMRFFEDENVVLNLSVWQSVAALRDFTFETDHKYFVKHRRRWFHAYEGRSFVLWPIDDPAIMPSAEAAFARLAALEDRGPSAFAFDWKTASDFEDA